MSTIKPSIPLALILLVCAAAQVMAQAQVETIPDVVYGHIDCFYVYPTVSNDTTPNNDMDAGPEERSVAQHQFARFGSQCRPYAPLYRQVTLTALRANLSGKPMTQKSSQPLDDRGAFDTGRGADRKRRQETSRGFAGITFSSVQRGSGCSSPRLLNRFDRSVFPRERFADVGQTVRSPAFRRKRRMQIHSVTPNDSA